VIYSERQSGVDGRLKAMMCEILSRQRRYPTTDYRIVMQLRMDEKNPESGANWELI
jgi:hypothetical protein